MKMPREVTAKISARATEIARQLAPKDTGKGAASLIPKSAEGEIGVEIPDEVYYMLFQEEGTKPRIMRELAGKTVPIRNPNGTISFRRATESNIGRRVITTRNAKGQIVASKLTWRHPGIKGKHFIQQGMQQAVQEWANTSSGQELMRMLDESEVKTLMDILKGIK